MTLMHRLAVTTALLPLLLLPACSDEEDPRPPIVSPTTTTPSPSPTQSVTTVPANETPEQFIRRWIEAGNQMQQDGDTKPYLALTSKCVACDGFADAVAKIYSGGGSVERKGTRVLGVREVAEQAGVTTVEVDVDPPPSKILDQSGRTVRTLPGGRTTYLVELLRAGGEWRVRFYGELDQ